MKRVINCFYEDSHGGIGDFLRGSIYLYKYCEDRSIKFYIDTRYHPISKHIKTKQIFSYETLDIIDVYKKINKSRTTPLSSVKKFYSRVKKETNNAIMKNCSKKIFIYTNYSDLFLLNEADVIPSITHTENLTESCKKFFRENLIFSEEINNHVKEILRENNLKSGEFGVVHFRLGDERSFLGLEYASTSVSFTNLLSICKERIKTNQKPIIVLADNNKLKEYLSKKAKEENIPIIIPHLKSNHSQKRPSQAIESIERITKDDCFYIATDMKIITLANRVDCYSVYFWGSGFATWIAKIFNVNMTANYIS